MHLMQIRVFTLSQVFQYFARIKEFVIAKTMIFFKSIDWNSEKIIKKLKIQGIKLWTSDPIGYSAE